MTDERFAIRNMSNLDLVNSFLTSVWFERLSYERSRGSGGVTNAYDRLVAQRDALRDELMKRLGEPQV